MRTIRRVLLAVIVPPRTACPACTATDPHPTNPHHHTTIPATGHRKRCTCYMARPRATRSSSPSASTPTARPGACTHALAVLRCAVCMWMGTVLVVVVVKPHPTRSIDICHRFAHSYTYTRLCLCAHTMHRGWASQVMALNDWKKMSGPAFEEVRSRANKQHKPPLRHVE